MAKYVFDARKYPVGTLLSDLGFFVGEAGTDYIVVLTGSNPKYWRATSQVTDALMSSSTLHTAYEVLLTLQGPASYFRSITSQQPTQHGFKLHPLLTEIAPVNQATYPNGYADYVLGYVLSNNDKVCAEIGTMTTTTNAVPSISRNGTMAARMRVNSDGTYQYKIWPQTGLFPNTLSLEDSESSFGWNLEGLTGVAAGTPFAVATPTNFGTANADCALFNSISIGTDGDTAEFPDEALVLTEPTVSVSDVTGTTATVNWS